MLNTLISRKAAKILRLFWAYLESLQENLSNLTVQNVLAPYIKI